MNKRKIASIKEDSPTRESTKEQEITDSVENIAARA